MNPYSTLQKGDRVTRMLGGTVPMDVRVSRVTEKTIECGPWTFNRYTGMEIDPDLGWDGVTHTGSTLRAPKEST